MKIVHICTTGPWGEQYAYQENLLPHYHRVMGHDVTILAPVYSLIGYGKEGVLLPGTSVLPDGIRLIRLAPLIKNILFDSHLHLVKGMRKVLLEEKPDLLFVHDVCSFNYLCLSGIKKKIPGVKIVFDNHGDYINSLHSPLTRFLHKVVYKHLLTPRLIKIAEWFYGVTPSRCTFLKEVYGVPDEKIKLLVMGADDEKMMLNHKEQLRKEVRLRNGIKDDDFLIVTGGKIDRRKNIHVLAHAVNALDRKNVKLLIFGNISDEMQPFFDAEKSSNIITIGWTNSEKVYELFYAADLIVFPGLHSVLWEQAVASKTPCAFSKMEGFEHVNVNDNCILMTGKNDSYYREMLNDLLMDEGQYNKLKTNSNSDATEQFYYSRIARQVLIDLGL